MKSSQDSKNNSSNMTTELWKLTGQVTYSLHDFFFFCTADQGPRVLDAGLRCKEPSFQVALPCLEFHLADDPAIGMSRSKRVMDRKMQQRKTPSTQPTKKDFMVPDNVSNDAFKTCAYKIIPGYATSSSLLGLVWKDPGRGIL